MDEDGKLLGEDYYPNGINADAAWRKLEPDEIPDEWFKLAELSQRGAHRIAHEAG